MTAEIYIADVRSPLLHGPEALRLLSPRRAAAAEGMVDPLQRLHCIAAGLLLRYALGPRAAGEVCADEFGKLRCAASEQPFFNLSHGGDYCVLALGGCRLGVDIEPIPRKTQPLPEAVLLPQEAEWLAACPTPEDFCLFWTRLESCLKADGRGFELHGRDFSPLDERCPWQLRSLCHDGHIISCAAESAFDIKLCVLRPEQLLE